MKCVTDFGTYDVNARRTSYRNNSNLAIALDSPTGVPFAILTVNLNGSKLPANYAFVDTNNCPWAEQFIKEHNLGKPTGSVGFSGYCVYPLYEFDMSKLGEE